jgi:hypothetical protein
VLVFHHFHANFSSRSSALFSCTQVITKTRKKRGAHFCWCIVERMARQNVVFIYSQSGSKYSLWRTSIAHTRTTIHVHINHESTQSVALSVTVHA